jgi:hypothetical protein
LPESHRIFDHLFLEGVFSAALPTPRGWKGLLIGEGWRDSSPSLCAEGELNCEAEQLQGVDIQLDHTGARLQGRLVPQCAPDRGREL